MNHEISKKFIEAENEGATKIQQVFDEYFSEFQKDYERMAELMLVIKSRIEYYLDDDEMLKTYINLRIKITVRSNNDLNDEELEEFAELADNNCLETTEFHS